MKNSAIRNAQQRVQSNLLILLAVAPGSCAFAQEREVVFQSSFDDRPVVSISLSGPSSLASASGGQMQAFAHLRAGARMEITGDVNWTSSDTSIATIDGTGRIETDFIGTTLITATAELAGQPAMVGTRELSTHLPVPIHQFTFNEETGANALLLDKFGDDPAYLVNKGPNDATVGGGVVTMMGGLRAQSDFVSLPVTLFDGLEDTSIEIWAMPTAIQNWSRVLDLGIGTDNFLQITWTRFTSLGDTRIEWVKDGSPLFTAENEIGPFALNTEHQIVITINRIGPNQSDITWYQNGDLRGGRIVDATLSDLRPPFPDINFHTLGRSKFDGDATASAIYNEVRVYDGVLSANGARASYLNGPWDGYINVDISIASPPQPRVGTTTQMHATVSSTGGPSTQDVTWEVSPLNRARIDDGGQLISLQAGAVTVTARLRNRPSVQATSQLVIAPAANPTPSYRVTAANLVGDLNALPFSYSVQSWSGMNWPFFPDVRGLDSHLQGVARIGSYWVLSHSMDPSVINSPGVVIWGKGTVWHFEDGLGLQSHPGGIQASADVVAVTHKDEDKMKTGIRFYRLDESASPPTFSELVHLRKSPALGEAVGLAWHPDHGRYYLLDSGTQDRKKTDSLFCRTSKIGAPLSDLQNEWECTTVNTYVSSEGTQLMFDETTRNLYSIALFRDGKDDSGNAETSIHKIVVYRIIFPDNDPLGPFEGVSAEEAGSRSSFAPMPGLFTYQPSFRWASGVFLDGIGHVGLIGTERCVPPSPPTVINLPPCEAHQTLTDYFIIQ